MKFLEKKKKDDSNNIRFYKTRADRQRALTQMVKRKKWNYFVVYLDVQGHALMYNNTCTWATVERPAIQ